MLEWNNKPQQSTLGASGGASPGEAGFYLFSLALLGLAGYGVYRLIKS